MDFISKIGDVLFLEDGKNYQVVDRCVHCNKNYLLLINVPDKVKDIFDIESREVVVVKEIVEEGEFSLSIIEDEKLIGSLEKKMNDKNFKNNLYIKKV